MPVPWIRSGIGIHHIPYISPGVDLEHLITGLSQVPWLDSHSWDAKTPVEYVDPTKVPVFKFSCAFMPGNEFKLLIRTSHWQKFMKIPIGFSKPAMLRAVFFGWDGSDTLCEAPKIGWLEGMGVRWWTMVHGCPWWHLPEAYNLFIFFSWGEAEYPSKLLVIETLCVWWGLLQSAIGWSLWSAAAVLGGDPETHPEGTETIFFGALVRHVSLVYQLSLVRLEI